MEAILTRDISIDKGRSNGTSGAVLRTVDRLAAARLAAEEKRKRDFRERLALPVASVPPELVLVRVGDVRFDLRYQAEERRDPARANRIALGWDWTRYKAIVINVRPDEPGDFWCPDGWHRVTAAELRMGADQRLMALLHRLPYEAEAAIFAEQHEEEKRVSEGLRFNAEKQSGDQVALAEQALLDRLGLSVARNAGPMTVPIRAFLGSYRRWGPDVLEEALCYAIDDLGGGTDAMESNMSKGIIGFVAAYRDHERYRPEIVRETLRKTTPGRIRSEGDRQASASLPIYDRVTAGLVYLYSYDRHKFRLPAWNGRLRGGRPR